MNEKDIRTHTIKCHDPWWHRTLDINDNFFTERWTLMPHVFIIVRVLLLVIFVALMDLVPVMIWLGMIGKFGQENISTPLTSPIPTVIWPTMIPTLRLKLRPSMWPIISPTLRPSLIPTECIISTPLLRLGNDDVKDGDQFGSSVLMFEF